MKKEIILFKEQKPANKEVLTSIEHYCKEHNLDFKFLNKKTPIRFTADGDLYETEIRVEHQEQDSYCMICCKNKMNPSLSARG